MKHITILYIISLCFSEIYAQKATIAFYSPEKEVTVRIYKPIDHLSYNTSIESDKIVLKPKMGINYELEIKEFAFVLCRFSDGNQRKILLFPDNRVEIIYDYPKITIRGDNAAGHNYFNDNYVVQGGYGRSLDDRIFEQYIQKGTSIKYDSIYNYLLQEILYFRSELTKMEMLNTSKREINNPIGIDLPQTYNAISSDFSAVLTSNLYFYAYNRLASIYGGLLKNAGVKSLSSWLVFDKKIIPSEEEIQLMYNQLTRLSKFATTVSDDIAVKLPDNYGDIYAIQYQLLDENARKNIDQSYEKNLFGTRSYYLLASEKMQLRKLSDALISYYKFDFGSFENPTKLLDYLDKKFPNSQYVAIINELKEKKNDHKKNEAIVLLSDSISSISELMQQSGIAGNYAYVDLWATWCTACLVEFEYNSDIRKILSQHKNIVPIYISLDKNKQSFENGVKKYDLQGYNVWASEELQKDIAKQVYKKNKIGRIPRYVLVSPKGEIVHENLTKPRNSEKLKSILDKILK